MPSAVAVPLKQTSNQTKAKFNEQLQYGLLNELKLFEFALKETKSSKTVPSPW